MIIDIPERGKYLFIMPTNKSIFYRSRRIGKNGKEFDMIKFRTLETNADQKIFAQEAQYTKHGKFLRKWKIDELPQLWNILKGEMTFVGPRPEERRNVEVLPFELMEQLTSIKPGLTSPASLHFYDEEKILEQSENVSQDYWVKIKPAKILLDIWYVQNKNWLIDTGLIWATIKKIITRK